MQHKIELTETKPIRRPYRRIPPAHFEEVKKHVEKLVEAGIVRESTSPWAAPIVIVQKRCKSIRLVTDYRLLNKVTRRDSFPLPRISDCLDALGGAKIFSTLDLTSGYYQVGVRPEDMEKTAFTTPFGLYEFCRLPMGLSNSASTFQRLMQGSLHDMLFQTLLVYLDDILVYADTFDKHLSRLEKLFQRLDQIGLKIKGSKCNLCKSSTEFLGHKISGEGIEPMSDRVDAIAKLPIPSTQKQLQSFIGAASYFRRFVKDFAKIAKPLHDLVGEINQHENKGKNKTKVGPKKIGEKWTEECDKAFKTLKSALTNAPVLGYPDFSARFIVETDACQKGISALLLQEQGPVKRVIAYASRTLRPTERNSANYSSRRLEFLAIKWAISEKFRSYLIGSEFDIITDHQSLVYWQNAKLNAIEQRWMAALSCFNYRIKHRSAAQNKCADYLSRNPVTNYEDETQRFSDEEGDVNICTTFLDAEQLSQTGTRLPNSLSQRIMSQQTDETVNCDAIYTMPGLKTSEVIKLQKADPDIRYFIERKDQNSLGKGNQISQVTKALYNQRSKIELREGILKRRYVGEDGRVFWQTIVPKSLTGNVLQSAHLGHQGRDRTLEILKTRCYWVGMVRDVQEYVSKCTVCSIAKPAGIGIRAPPSSILASRPLEMVSMDFTLLERDKHGYENVLVLTDTYTRFAVAVPTRNQTAATVARVLVDRWFSTFGVPERLHSDQGKAFESKIVTELCKLYNVKKTRTSPYNPTGNSITERFNNTLHLLLKTLPKEQNQRWSENLSAVTTIYNSTTNASTGYAPHFLMFGREPYTQLDAMLGLDREPDEVSHKWLAHHKQMLKTAHDRAKTLMENKAAKRREKVKEKPSRKIEVGNMVRKRLHHLGRSKIKPLWSEELYKVANIPGEQGGPFTLETLKSKKRFRVAGHEIKLFPGEDTNDNPLELNWEQVPIDSEQPRD